MIRWPLLLALGALGALNGCISGNAPPRCTGPVTATIRNNWSQSVDVYARMRSSSGFILGEVAPGERREFELPDDATGVYFDWRGGTIIRPTSADIATSYSCR